MKSKRKRNAPYIVKPTPFKKKKRFGAKNLVIIAVLEIAG
jgi:hypothetical protein